MFSLHGNHSLILFGKVNEMAEQSEGNPASNKLENLLMTFWKKVFLVNHARKESVYVDHGALFFTFTMVTALTYLQDINHACHTLTPCYLHKRLTQSQLWYISKQNRQ